MWGIVVIVCLSILWGMTLYFNHKEKMEKIKLESNPLNKIFSGDKIKEEK